MVAYVAATVAIVTEDRSQQASSRQQPTRRKNSSVVLRRCVVSLRCLCRRPTVDLIIYCYLLISHSSNHGMHDAMFDIGLFLKACS